MDLYLVVQSNYNIARALNNVGVFSAENKDCAINHARDKWGDNLSFYAYKIDDMNDGWSYFYTHNKKNQ